MDATTRRDAAPYDPPRLRGPWLWGGLVAAAVFVTVLRFVYVWFGDLAGGDRGTFAQRLFEELTGLLPAIPFVCLLTLLTRRATPERVGWPRAIARASIGFLGFTLVHTTLMVGMRQVVGSRLGYHWDPPSPERYLYEGANDLIVVAGFTSTLWLVDALMARRERERRNDALARALDAAQLENLRLQLQPHFLFNALNTISAAMYDDPGAADAMLQHLAELLRVSLRTEAAQEVALEEELESLAHYEALMRARMGDRLRVELDVDDEARAVLVPSLVLQPLVENALRHGRAAHEGAGHVRVGARVRGETLALEVWDDGPGAPPGRDPLDGAGTGLGATARRLRLLHGERARIEAGNVPGGFRVAITVPARRPAGGAPRAAATVARELHA